MTNDDRDFDDVAFTAGRGLASIGSTQPAMAAVRRRIAVRRASIMSSVAVLAVVSVVAVNVQRGSKPTVVDVAMSSTTSAPTVASGLPAGVRVISPDPEGVRVSTSDSSRVVVNAKNVTVAYEVSELDHFVYQTGNEGTWQIWTAERGVPRELMPLRGKQLLSLGRRGPSDVLVLRDERSADGNQWISLYDLGRQTTTRTGIADVPGAAVTMVSVANDVFAVSTHRNGGNDDFYFAKIDGSIDNDYANPNNAEPGESRRSRYAARLSADTKFVAYSFLGEGRTGIGVSLARSGDGFVGVVREISSTGKPSTTDFDVFGRYLLIPTSEMFDLQASNPNTPIPVRAAPGSTLSRASQDPGPQPTATSGPSVGTTTSVPQAKFITVAEPRRGAVVSATGPLLVRGAALTFESVVNIKVFDANGDLVIETKTMAAAPNGVPGPYTISIDFPTPVAHLGTGRLEVFEYSAKDGTEVHKVTVPITFAIVG